MDQKHTPHALDPVLEHLEDRHPDKEKARRILRSFMQDDLRDPTSQPPVKLLVALLSLVVRPLFKGQQEREGRVHELLTKVRNGVRQSDLAPMANEIREIALWIRDSLAEAATARRVTPILPRLLQAIKILGAGEEWLEVSAKKLQAVPLKDADANHWEKVNTFAHQVIDSGRALKRAWHEERLAYLKLVVELADQLETMRQNTGGIGRHLTDSIDRLRNSQTVEELQQFRIMLMREAEDLVRHTQEMQLQLADNQRQLTETRARMEALTEELQKTREESLTDPLTSIPNRRAFLRILDKELARATRNQHDLAIIILDLDFFKKVNDTYGHTIGDKVLIAIAVEVSRVIRQTDFLARYGGEEFILLLPETDREAAVIAAEKIRQEIAAIRFKTGTQHLTITASLGICAWQSGKMTADELIDRADQALYLAKQTGRNQAILAEPLE